MSPDIQSGCRYIITNHKGGTVIDLSGADNKSIIGYTRHGGENQQWEPTQRDNGWIIKNVRSGHYLGYEGQLSDGTKLVATEQPFVWHIWHDKEDPSAYRISVPDTNKDVDLSDHGNPTPGTPIALWGRWVAFNQAWYFERV
ncbi:ricin B-like lectin [Phlegmacium glaucopus]|nr:ricin B-like lectin [Phlegmacium glaucopus]